MLFQLQKTCTVSIYSLMNVRYVSSTYVRNKGNVIPFEKAKRGTFIQEAPFLENSFSGDAFLRRNLQRLLPSTVYDEVKTDLTRFGQRVGTDIYSLGRQCELNPPYLKVQDAWANPHNEVVTCEAWKQLKRISAEEGLVALAYERQYLEYSRLIQMVKNYLFYPSSGLYSCPLAMTDGAAKSLEVLNAKESQNAYSNLTTRNPDQFWTSGQWMTEKRGGSDVAGGTETVAVSQHGSPSKYKLYGYKFFSSATDADVALTLARVVDSQTGNITLGTRGLSLFLLKVHQLENLELIRLKQKLGTKQLPTGELLLDGMDAELISPIGRGVASISPMLSITRLHNAAASVSSMRRILSIARDYSYRRVAFGKLIKDHPLHVRTMAQMELECRAGVVLFFEAARLLGLEEVNKANSREQQLLRLILPLLKLYTGKQCIGVISEGLECFGGQGYMEDTGIPTILRDAQVTPIWEGTTNVLSLDVLRAISKSEGEVLRAFQDRLRTVREQTLNPSLQECCALLENCQDQLFHFAQYNAKCLDHFARDFAFGLARTLAGSLLVEHASWAGATESDLISAKRWIAQSEILPQAIQIKDIKSQQSNADDGAIVFDGYDPDNLLSRLF